MGDGADVEGGERVRLMLHVTQDEFELFEEWLRRMGQACEDVVVVRFECASLYDDLQRWKARGAISELDVRSAAQSLMAIQRAAERLEARGVEEDPCAERAAEEYDSL